jgi:hypothetical protein
MADGESPGAGCFGMSAVMGRRQQQDASATGLCETLCVTNEEVRRPTTKGTSIARIVALTVALLDACCVRCQLRELMMQDELSARHICAVVLRDQIRSERLAFLALELRYAFLRDDPDASSKRERMALLIQLVYARHRVSAPTARPTTYSPC